ncbi:hypothetical protein LguiA_030444 [Lonicera macranthoides]
MSNTRVPMSVWVYGFFKQDEFYWFSIDPSEDEVSEEELQKRRLIDDEGDDENYDYENYFLRHGQGPRPVKVEIPKIIEPILVTSGMYKSACAALDRFIYAFGGTDPYKVPLHPEPYIQCLDTTNVRQGFKRCMEMNMGRRDAQVADLDGKIYIFGGGAELGTAIAEVFDPLSTRVEKVEGYKDYWKLVGVDRGSKRILFIPYTSYKEDTEYETGPMVFYDTKTNRWNHETHPKLGHEIPWLLYGCCARVVVGTTIYWFSQPDLEIYAYDFVNKKFYFSGMLSDLPGCPDDWRVAFPLLFHMNEGYFCMVWVLSYLYDLNHKQIHCTKLHISKCTTHDWLSVYVMDTDTYLIAGGDFKMMGAVPVYVSFGSLMLLLIVMFGMRT